MQDVRDTVVTATVPREGGTVELRGVGRVIFGRGTFDSPQAVTVATTSTPTTEAGRVTWAVSVGPPDPLPYDVRIRFAGASPSGSFEVVLSVPESYLTALPPGRTPRMFAQIVSGGPFEDLDNYQSLELSFYDAISKSVHAVIPLDAIRRPGSDGTSRVILVVGVP